MNEHLDPMEAELAALQPVSPSPQLRQQIGDRLTEPGRASLKTLSLWERVASGASRVREFAVETVLQFNHPHPGPLPKGEGEVGRGGRWYAIAGRATLVAAMVIAIVFVLQRDDARRSPRLIQTEITPPDAFDPSLPSLWTYQRALVHSTELDELLQRHAGSGDFPDHNLAQERGFRVSDLSIRFPLGEL